MAATVFLAAAVLALALTPVVRMLARRTGLGSGPRDRPAPAVPRTGGIAVFVAWAVVLLLAPVAATGSLEIPLSRGALLLAATLIFLLGLADDHRPVPAWIKLAVEVLGAACLVASGLLIERVTINGHVVPLGWFAPVATILWCLLVTNAFNLLDGLDGLAAGLALIAGTTCVVIAFLRQDTATMTVLLPLLGALAGFLPFNSNPASVFLGDSGSLVVGFILAATSISGLQKGATALASGVPMLIFALPLFDTLTTILRRLVRPGEGEAWSVTAAFDRLFRPDRRHVHHQLVETGLSERAAVFVLYGIALAGAVVAVATAER